MKKPSFIRFLATLVPLALLFLLPGSAVAADTYEAAWNGAHLIATANADFTEATIESVSVSFNECETAPEEATCTWEATAFLISHPGSRCDPNTPEQQVAWESGPQSSNGTVEDGPKSFPLEGCRGQALVFRIEFKKTYEEGGSPLPWRTLGGGSEWPMFTFGYHPVAEEEQRTINVSPPASPALPPLVPNFTPRTFALSPDCRTLQLDSTRYAFVFQQMGCYKAGNLARVRFRSGRAPLGCFCQHLSSEGVRCWRRHQPAKFFEWHLRGSRS